MRIARIETTIVSSRLVRPFITSRRRVEHVRSVQVAVIADDGTVGHGAASENPSVTGESIDSIRTMVEGPIADSVVGIDAGTRGFAARIAQSCSRNANAKAAVDVAIQDAYARQADVPVSTMIGGAANARMDNDMTVSLKDPEAMARDAADAQTAGYTHIKIKLGTDPGLDMQRLHAVHDAAPSVWLRLDANQGWRPKPAQTIIGRIEDAALPVEFIEQPVAWWDLDGLADVTRSASLPIMADESLGTPADALELAKRGCADMFNIKLAKCGGIWQALQIADIADAAGIACMVGAMMEPRLPVVASAHVATAHPNITGIDLDSAEWFEDGSAGGYVADGGTVQLTGGPGLDVTRAAG